MPLDPNLQPAACGRIHLPYTSSCESGQAPSPRPRTAGLALDDARWFPADLHLPAGTFSFQAMTPESLDRTAFLDTRMAPSPQPPVAISARAVDAAEIPAGSVAWLFHTSFCCSTLLARVLHLPPYQVSLKEPLVLRRLGDMRFVGASVDPVLETTTRLLARAWHPGGAVLVKPTHAALNVATDLLASRPGSKAIVLTSSLEDFLVSNLKKSEETQRKIPLLVERAFRATTLHTRLPPTAFNPPDILAAAALQWAAQREVCLDLLDAAGADAVRVLDASELLADLPGVSTRCSRWLALPAPEDAVAQRSAAVRGSHAKALDHEYGPERRAAEASMVRSQCDGAVERALQWFDRCVRPAMRPQALTFAGATAL